MVLASGSSQDCRLRLMFKYEGSLVCWLLGSVPAAAIYCLQGDLPNSSRSSCLGTPLHQETYPFLL